MTTPTPTLATGGTVQHHPGTPSTLVTIPGASTLLQGMGLEPALVGMTTPTPTLATGGTVQHHPGTPSTLVTIPGASTLLQGMGLEPGYFC
uniref:Uncharacterized protein n=1 Tax=Romanomermis culicivorax TaxID=13658 RepID=A0A915HM46_ROMCU